MARSKCFQNSFSPTAEFKALRASAVNEDSVITIPNCNYLGNVNTAFLKIHCKDSSFQTTTSLLPPPVTTSGPPPTKNTKTAPTKTSKLGSLTFKVQDKKTKGESVAERSVTEGTLAESKAKPASLVSRKTSDSKKGKLLTASVAQSTDCSDSGASHTLLSSQNLSHLSSSQKVDISVKGQTTSVGDNTPIADVVQLAKDPSQLSSITAPAVNVPTQSQVGIQAETSASDDPLAKTQADDDEEATPMDISDYDTPLADIPFPITPHQTHTTTQPPLPTSSLADIPFPTTFLTPKPYTFSTILSIHDGNQPNTPPPTSIPTHPPHPNPCTYPNPPSYLFTSYCY